MAEKYKAPSVIKAFQILRLLSIADQGLGISDIAKRLGISKGTIHGITSALDELGAIRRDPVTKRYTLGYTLFELGRRAHGQIDLKSVARPIMEDLMQKSRSSVLLGVLNRDHVTILDVVESTSDFKITAPVGTTLPLLAGAVGKVFLSGMDEARVMEIVGAKGLHKYTDHSITAPGEFIDQIRRAGQQGFAADDEEYIPGVRAVASPIYSGTGRAMHAIWVVGFKASLDDQKMVWLAGETLAAANGISRELEGSPGHA